MPRLETLHESRFDAPDAGARNGLAQEMQRVRVVNKLRDKRVLVSASGKGGNVLKIRPPLPFTSENNRQFLNLLDEALGELIPTPVEGDSSWGLPDAAGM